MWGGRAGATRNDPLAWSMARGRRAEEVIQGVRIPVGRGFAGRIAAERRPVILERVEHGLVMNPLLLKRGIRSLVGVPLMVHGAVLGVLHAGTLQDRAFTADDAALLQLAADRAAVAVQSLRSRDVCYAVLDPGSGQLAISSAGHLPPVIASLGQRTELADIVADIPIGVTSYFGRQVTTLTRHPVILTGCVTAAGPPSCG